MKLRVENICFDTNRVSQIKLVDKNSFYVIMDTGNQIYISSMNSNFKEITQELKKDGWDMEVKE